MFITIAGDGAILFIALSFVIQRYAPKKVVKKRSIRGVYHRKDGDLDLMSGALTLANGLAFNDGSLFVADTADG